MERKASCIILLTFVTFEVISGFVRSSYGELCNKTHKCDSSGWLGCFDGVCDCAKKEEMEFLSDLGKCVSKAGERCKYILEEIKDGILFEMTDCIENSECNSDGYCVCDSKYHEVYNGTCRLSKSINEKCSYVDKCSKYENLKCVAGTCQCQEENSTFSPEEDKCVGLSKKPCVNGNCVPGAICGPEEDCVCIPHFYHNSTDNLCYETKGVFESCRDDFECRQQPGVMLSCVNEICNCPPNLKYDTVRKYEYNCIVNPWHCDEHSESNWNHGFSGELISRCVSLVGDNCPEGYCVSNAKCDIPVDKRYDENRRYKHGTCKCVDDKDYIRSRKNTTCAKKHGKRCIYTDECVDELECIEKKCTCHLNSMQKVSKTLNGCYTAVGGHCTKDSICYPNAFCDTGIGFCKCKKGFLPNAIGNCEVEFGRNCSDTIVCDSIASLVCINNKCGCPDKMYRYSPLHRRCSGLVGAKCKEDGMEGECTENAKCTKYHAKLPAKCKCMPGFGLTQDHTCKVKVNPTITSNNVV